jgi:DNA polymerase-3 subunit delta'
MTPFETLCPWLGEALRTLENAALQQRLGHGWLISGPSGIGKANLAYVLAHRLLHNRDDAAVPPAASPADVAADYRLLDEGVDLHPDLHRVRPEEDKHTISVEQVRTMISELALTPHRSARKLVIIEQADSLTTAAANALLKSLEEPRPSTFILLLANRPGRLPATIRSRCQRLVVRQPSASIVDQWLGELAPAVRAGPSGDAVKTPIALALLAMDDDKYRNYIKIKDKVKQIFDAKVDPHAMADEWLKGDLDLALGCLIARLQSEIRDRLIPRHSTRVTDAAAGLTDNPSATAPTDALFRSLEMAENLRDQLGRGINAELALKSLLLDIKLDLRQRVTM